MKSKWWCQSVENTRLLCINFWWVEPFVSTKQRSNTMKEYAKLRLQLLSILVSLKNWGRARGDWVLTIGYYFTEQKSVLNRHPKRNVKTEICYHWIRAINEFVLPHRLTWVQNLRGKPLGGPNFGPPNLKIVYYLIFTLIFSFFQDPLVFPHFFEFWGASPISPMSTFVLPEIRTSVDADFLVDRVKILLVFDMRCSNERSMTDWLKIFNFSLHNIVKFCRKRSDQK